MVFRSEGEDCLQILIFFSYCEVKQMMHVFYCIKCKRYHYTNNQARAVCCGQPMYRVNIEFTDFVKMDLDERKEALKIYSLAE